MEMDLPLLLTAAECNAVERLKVLLDNGEDPNQTGGERNNTALHIAANYNSYEAAKLLIRYGANVDLQNNRGDTPLHLAASSYYDVDNQQAPLARLLVRRGRASVNLTNNRGRTPLHVAAHYGLSGVAEVLLKAGAEMDPRDIDGRTPLHRLAVVYENEFCGGHHRIAELLACRPGKSADVDAKDYRGNTPLHLAAKTGNSKLAWYLVRHCWWTFIDLKNNQGRTPLHLAAANDSWFVAEILLDTKATFHAAAAVDEECNAGWTPLSYAAMNPKAWDRRLGLVQLLVQHDANVSKAFQGIVLFEHLFPWINDNPQRRSILSLRTGDDTNNADDIRRSSRRLNHTRLHWRGIVQLLRYHYHGVDWEGPPPPVLEELPSDEAFLEEHRWMIHPLASLLHKGSGRIMKLLFQVYDPGLLLDRCNLTNKTPLWTALDTWSPQDWNDQQDLERALDGLEILLTANPRALRVRHPDNKRFPLAAALAKGLPMPIVIQMAELCPAVVRQRDCVTGLPIYVLALSDETSRHYTRTALCCWVSTGVVYPNFPQLITEVYRAQQQDDLMDRSFV